MEQVKYKPELYRKTVDILFDAYFNDTLEHGNCYACAVGNLVAAHNGYKFISGEPPMGVYTGHGNLFWNKPIPISENIVMHLCEINNGDRQQEDLHLSSRVVSQLESTGYSFKELTQIEKSFESTGKENSDLNMFNGLVAVLATLKEIHQVEDNAEEVLRFKNHYKNKCVEQSL